MARTVLLGKPDQLKIDTMKKTIEALEMSDLPVVMGSILFIASIFIALNIIVDLIYVKLDPRVKLSS